MKNVVFTRFVDGGEQRGVAVAVDVGVGVKVRVGVAVKVSVEVMTRVEVGVSVKSGVLVNDAVPTGVIVSVMTGFNVAAVSVIVSWSINPIKSMGVLGCAVYRG